jgi:hypothetical protein
MRSSGGPALLRYVHEGRVSRILPANVVADGPEGVGLLVRAGTPIRVRARPDGSAVPRELPYAERFGGDWVLGDDVWRGDHAALLAPAAEPFAYFAFFDESWELRGWYVNLQEPLRPTAFGWDTTDNVLDAVVDADLTGWTWKDEDELREAVRVGRFDEARAASLYRDGDRARARIERREWPFDRDWSSWRPDPAWPAPRLDPAAEIP